MVVLSALTAFRFDGGKQGGPMVYPITIGAKFSQHPFRHMYKSSKFVRCLVYATVVTMPLWVYINSLVNSPQAKAAWAAKKRAEAHKEHLAHMWSDIEGKNANK